MTEPVQREAFLMRFDPGTIKHLGLRMYSTLPPVIGELVSNAWDAGAQNVYVTVPTTIVGNDSVISVEDDGDGMGDQDIRKSYLIVGRDRRAEEESDKRKQEPIRPVMGRKGIGKFAGFGIAKQVEVETVNGQESSRFVMDFDALSKVGDRYEIYFPPLPPTSKISRGTLITLSDIQRFRTKPIDIIGLRRGLARRFSVLSDQFILWVNDKRITPEERDLKRLLQVGDNKEPYLWEFDEIIEEGTNWRVKGWIGALDKTDSKNDGIQRGIVIMARGKLVQDPFVFEATVGQQYALSYLVGELHAEFVDEAEDTIGTTRNSLVWDTPANETLLKWGKHQVQTIARQWAKRRSEDNESRLKKNEHYKRFVKAAEDIDNKRALKIADKLIRDVVTKNVLADDEETTEVVQLCLDFLEFDAFWDLAEDLASASVTDPVSLARLFREWEIVEAKEMARVTEGRIATIEKLQTLIQSNALEVPTLHRFLKEFPWVLDPRWQLVDDEVRYSALLREEFKEPDNVLETDRRIDFLCVREADSLVVVEIKRPQSKASRKELNQIEDYVLFMRAHLKNSTDVEYSASNVVGYLLCGSLVKTPQVHEKKESLARDNIRVRSYSDLLGMVEGIHKEFLARYRVLRELKKSQLEERL